MKNEQKLQQQLTDLQEQNELMRQLATPEGFFKYFFKQLPNYKNQVECFNAVNDQYFDIFGEYRYSSYYSFASGKLWGKRRKKK